MAEQIHPESVEFWFDPSCPWCWMTSRWLSDVAEQRDFTVTWHPFSLKILNEDRPEAQQHAAGHALGLQALRVIEQARADHGDRVVGDLYTEIGTRVHPGGRTDTAGILRDSLAALDLPAALADAAQPDTADRPGTDGIDGELRASTRRALDLVGDDVGVPILAIDGVGFFGPVVTPAPSGAAALQLFDGVVQAAAVDGFYELKRTRTAGPSF